MRVTGDLGGNEGLGRDKFVEGTVDTGLLLRVVWARQATGEVARDGNMKVRFLKVLILLNL
jgi:hypothetical protein